MDRIVVVVKVKLRIDLGREQQGDKERVVSRLIRGFQAAVGGSNMGTEGGKRHRITEVRKLASEGAKAKLWWIAL